MKGRYELLRGQKTFLETKEPEKKCDENREEEGRCCAIVQALIGVRAKPGYNCQRSNMAPTWRLYL